MESCFKTIDILFYFLKKASQEINNIIYNNVIISVNVYLNVMFINHI